MATRLYFSRLLASAISPAFGGWTLTSIGTPRRKLLAAKDPGESLGSASFEGRAGGSLALQLVSEPLEAQTISGTVKAYVRAANDTGNGDALSYLLIRVCSNDGNIIRGTLLALGHHGASNPFFSSLRNRVFADGDTLSDVAAQAGDRLLVELGADNADEDELILHYGAPSGTADLPENETEATALVPWIEFSANLSFQAAATNKPTLALLGVGQ